MDSNPKNIIKFWASVEKFTPYEVETKKKIGNVKSIQKEVLRNHDITWLNKERFKHYHTKTHTWNYTVFLGILDHQDIILEMKRLLEVDIPDHDLQKSKSVSCIACFQVNFEGKPLRETLELPDYFIGISSLVLLGKDHKNWADDKNERVRKKITDIFHNYCDKMNQPKNKDPVVFDDLNFLLKSFVEVSGWTSILDREFIRNTAVIHASNIKIPQPKKDGTIEEIKHENNTILKSFYIDDLQYVEKEINEKFPEKSNIGKALKQYLNIVSSNKKEDLVKEIKYLKEYSSPNMLPAGRWPGKGHYPLSLTQQLSVNLSFKESEGLFSVNGPPGTGKTTLLRDIISNVIVSRAKQLANLKNPEDAYKNSKEIKVEHYNYKAWHLIPELTGHEIFVASCNNGAIENISKEIPRKSEIDKSFELDYFSDIATYTMGEECWGLGAAPLGNKKNRSDFFNKFWKKKPENNHDSDFGLKYFLENLKVKQNWQDSKESFLKKLHLFNQHQKELSAIEKIINKISNKIAEIKKNQNEIKNYELRLSVIEDEKNKLEKEALNLRSKIEKQKYLISSLKEIKPFFMEMVKAFFGLKSTYPGWQEKYTHAFNILSDLFKEEDTVCTSLETKKSQFKEQEDLIKKSAILLKNLEQKLQEDQSLIQPFKNKMNKNFPDNEFWKKPDKELQLLTPWLYEELHRIRGEVFIEAMNLHKSFIQNTSIKLMNNLKCMDLLMQGNLPKENESYLKSIWSSFFLVVPVVSTTFASFSNLCSGLNKEDIGWLLIDEAGQASLQSAVGAIFRSKRVIVVGDPLQIKPVVTLPKAMSDALMNYHNVSNKWNPMEESVQTLSDRINSYGTYIGRDENRRWVGAPLRVHRRCNEPMFSISNSIAYDNLMIQATKNKKSVIENIYPESIWIDVPSATSEENWIKEEGIVVKEIIHNITSKTKRLPSLYIISPYNTVASNMKKLLNENDANEEFGNWINKSVGTIHTFQGKQAEVVILLLGGNPSKPGAIDWAAKEPNILNVGITRAKNLVIVVGNYERWSKRPYFQDLSYKVEKHVASVVGLDFKHSDFLELSSDYIN